MARFQAIACDYDSTLAHDGRVAPEVLQVLQGARASDKKLILVTGRTLDELRRVFAELAVFDLVVGENGAVLLDPSVESEEPLCGPLPASFIRALAQRKVPFSVGRRVIATHRPYDVAVQRLVEELELEINVVLNRESVMILPGGIDKGSGLGTALQRLRLQASEVVGVGDAENDFSFLRLCGFSVAVANAIDALKREVDYVTQGRDGAGVSEIIQQVIAGGSLVEADQPR